MVAARECNANEPIVQMNSAQIARQSIVASNCAASSTTYRRSMQNAHGTSNSAQICFDALLFIRLKQAISVCTYNMMLEICMSCIIFELVFRALNYGKNGIATLKIRFTHNNICNASEL